AQLRGAGDAVRSPGHPPRWHVRRGPHGGVVMAREAPRRARSRGLTLVEALITAAILSIIFAGITAALIATQRQVGMLSSQAEAQSALRMGLSQIGQALTRAGFGMDPAYAIMTATYGDTGDLQAIRDGSGPFG